MFQQIEVVLDSQDGTTGHTASLNTELQRRINKPNIISSCEDWDNRHSAQQLAWLSNTNPKPCIRSRRPNIIAMSFICQLQHFVVAMEEREFYISLVNMLIDCRGQTVRETGRMVF